MKPITLARLSKILNTGPAPAPTGGAEKISGVSIDSRTVKGGECFFAIRGENFDGHDYLDAAFANGAAAAVTMRDCKTDGVVFKVPDTVKALGDLARWYRDHASFKVVAITGSAGKTTTKQIIHTCLKDRFNCFQSPKSFNNDIGLPLTLLAAGTDYEIVIAEVGSNYPGEISYLSGIARPNIALITNIHPAHLAGFGTIEAIVKEKSSIIAGLKTDGVLLINGDYPQLAEHLRDLGREFTTFGQSQTCDITATDWSTSGSCGKLTIEGTTVCVPLPGRANLANTLAAWSVCKQLGLTIAEFAKAVKTLGAIPMRMEILTDFDCGLTVINDCYNANPASMANALECLTQIAKNSSPKKRRKVFICGTMAELGPQSRELHTQLGTIAADCGVSLLLAVGDFAENVVEAARKGTKNDLQAHVFENITELCDNLQKLVRYDDIVLVKGSRARKTETAVDKLREIFS